ncbi:AAA family ATPase [Pseudobutyrivibrio sp. LB2011]|uniref:AAA family ATPase n=1 Tax=Pseudobutyrivibrio sp. LB2011 TaxID=1408312 RepID=UPI0005D143E0|nr:AAA family ATPase [Pseudobutyrivibrio sp. LB2011]
MENKEALELANNLIRTRNTGIDNQISHWLDTTSFHQFYEEIEKSVIGQPELKLFLANIWHYLLCLRDGAPVNNNVLLAAPSGSGKTETYRALRAYFAKNIPGFPIYSFDTSQLTTTGFKGADASEILEPLALSGFQKAMGIVFLDEFDKKIMPSYATGRNDVNAEVQSNLLTIVEGAEVKVKKDIIVNTNRVMFVGMGSFDSFRKKREDVPVKIGFGANAEDKKVEHYAPITKEDMLEAGGTNEFIGRFPLVINYQKLTHEAFDKIIDKLVESLEISYGCELKVSQEMRAELYNMVDSKFGCRAFESQLRTLILREYMYALTEEKEDVLVVEIKDKATASHHWRYYTDDEITIMNQCCIEMAGEEAMDDGYDDFDKKTPFD